MVTLQDRVIVTLPRLDLYEAIWLQAEPAGERKELHSHEAKA
ncbi:hypothetical protein [Paenibacillus sp. JCM 10914]|nr:hypothetical protein [Paenibacillus sp. JCM 10914]